MLRSMAADSTKFNRKTILSVLNMLRQFSCPSLDNVGHFSYCKKFRGVLEYSGGYMCICKHHTPVYVGYLSICRSWHPSGFLEPTSLGFEEMAVCVLFPVPAGEFGEARE